jgi:hypothetical protein
MIEIHEKLPRSKFLVVVPKGLIEQWMPDLNDYLPDTMKKGSKEVEIALYRGSN